MRIVFLGTAHFAVPILDVLLRSGHEVVGVVTGPDKPAGRGRKLQPTPVKQRALEEEGIPILTPKRLKTEEFRAQFAALEADAAVVVAYRILPPSVFNIPRLGTLNVHPSLLPKYRGPAPLNWALINGDDETAVSVIRISEVVDAGGVVLQNRVKLDPLETADDLARRLAPMGGEMILEALQGLEDGSLRPIPQDEALVTKAPKLAKEDGEIDWAKPAEVVHNRIRGLYPWPGSYTMFDGKMLKLFASRQVEGKGEPGEVLEAGNELVIACGSGAVAFKALQKQGKRRMSVEEYLRGQKLSVGTVLGD